MRVLGYLPCLVKVGTGGQYEVGFNICGINFVIRYFLIFDTSVQLWTLVLLWAGWGVKKL